MIRLNPIAFSLASEKLAPCGIVAEVARPIVLSGSDSPVDIWSVALHQALSGPCFLKKLLPETERAQGMRLRSASDRRRFLLRRAARRLVLSRYLGRPPETLVFAEGDMGKPALVCSRELQFNCSASGNLALIGVTMGRRVGVDVEQLRPVPGSLDIAKEFFSRNELEALRRMPSTDRSVSFLRLWTCKEAWTKAKGAGLNLSFSSFDIDCDPLPQLRKTEGDPHERHQWCIQNFVPAPGFIGAVAVESADPNGITERPPHSS